MLLTIDLGKVQAELAKTMTSYVVAPSTLEIAVEHGSQPSGVGVVSTVVSMPLDTERARTRLLTLRQRLVERGNAPLSDDELDRHIAETRGR